jgi:adenylate cyclase
MEGFRAWQRCHIRLTTLYGSAVLVTLAIMGAVFYALGVDSSITALQQRLLATTTSLASAIDGDAILAVFGAPHYLPDHSERAVRCALSMRERLVELNQEWRQSGLSQYWQNGAEVGLSERIGIHTGPVVAGNLGGTTRMKYAVIGDSVNVASRLESLNKELDTDILVSEQVYTHLPGDLLEQLQDKGVHRVKGRQQSVRVFGIDRDGSDAVTDRAQSA